ncbi:MAG: uracil-DNA glycosylase [Alphaproteobacteria bacterium]|nr:uracil-DNA glycosylase [Alphaproteobacteria bacterium]MBV9370609.1 uracil-DNA glycosylase [Alphaproteobacteria bacterium]MBV9900163.1 uracil-DNA glycosylase [Alphaproteobacteria bacterium]
MERESDFTAAEAAASVLQWWSDAGLDALVDEGPRDWLKPRPAPGGAPAAPDASPAAAAEAPLPDQLDLFRAWLADAPGLPFASPGAPRICPSGDPAAGLMIVADMPTGEDCTSGTLISGEAGRLFDRMLAAIGRDRASIYLAALSCLRSPDGRFGTEGAQSCAALARHHIGLAMPKAVLLLGDACSKALVGLPLVQARGRWHEIATHAGPVKAIVTLAPSFLLNQPALKAHAWADLQRLIEEVNR